MPTNEPSGTGAPGRIAAIHVKDRTVPGGMTGMGHLHKNKSQSLVLDTSRTDQLRCGGNGVVALTAGLAFVTLARRAARMDAFLTDRQVRRERGEGRREIEACR